MVQKLAREVSKQCGFMVNNEEERKGMLTNSSCLWNFNCPPSAADCSYHLIHNSQWKWVPFRWSCLHRTMRSILSRTVQQYPHPQPSGPSYSSMNFWHNRVPSRRTHYDEGYCTIHNETQQFVSATAITMALGLSTDNLTMGDERGQY